MLKKDYDKRKKQLKEQAEIAKQCEGGDVQYFNVGWDASSVSIHTDPLAIGLCNLQVEDCQWAA